MIRFVLPVDPLTVQTGGKRICVIAGRPRFFKTKKVEKWETAVGLLSNPHRPRTPFAGPIRLTAVFVLKRPQSLAGKKHPDGRLYSIKRPDVDNLVKGLQDALKGFWEDDSQVVEMALTKVYAAKGEEPKIEITIESINEKPYTQEDARGAGGVS
jgi:Holliday junction resolvase RusA-like endonuclease